MSNTIPLPATPYVLAIAGDGYSDDHCTSFPAWDDGAMYDHAAAVSASDNAALRAELDEWRFTNKVDELDRHVARQAERIKVLEDALQRYVNYDLLTGTRGKMNEIAREALGDKT